MSSAISRMQFLRGDFSGRSRSIRPPWSLPEEEFVQRCTRCGDCRSACPQQILQRGRGGFPEVDFSRGECLFCGECVHSCTPEVLTGWAPQLEGRVPWSVRAHIAERCLALQGVDCRSCGDHCDTRAIRFRLVAGGVPRPVLNLAECNGCGACYGACPVQAIELGDHNQPEDIQL